MAILVPLILLLQAVAAASTPSPEHAPSSSARPAAAACGTTATPIATDPQGATVCMPFASDGDEMKVIPPPHPCSLPDLCPPAPSPICGLLQLSLYMHWRVALCDMHH